jgi:isopenicillin N synthase-like dioxygenase
MTYRKGKTDSRVNVADAMQFWTSQKLKSTTHRVQIPPRQRFSIAYFVQPDPDTVYP